MRKDGLSVLFIPGNISNMQNLANSKQAFHGKKF